MFTLPNLLTAGNLLCGIFSLFLIFSGRIDLACFVLYVALLFDFLDGFVARKLKLMGDLGKQLDSLADMVTFGVAPGVLACVLLIVSSQDGIDVLANESFSVQLSEHISVFLLKLSVFDLEYSDYRCFLGLLIPFFSLFRLAKFNVDVRQSESFIGLPTPANTLFFSAFPLLMAHYFQLGENNLLLDFLLRPPIFMAIIVIMSYLLIAEMPLFSLKVKHFKWFGNEIRFIFLGLSLLVLLICGVWALLIIVLLYLFLSLIETIKTRFT